MEQDRAPAVLVHHPELARRNLGQLSRDRRSDRRDDHKTWLESLLRTRRKQLSQRHLAIFGLAILRIRTLGRRRSIVAQLENPVRASLRHFVQSGLNGTPILLLVRRQTLIRLEAGDARIGPAA